MRANPHLAEALTVFLRRMERTTSADNFFYLAHRDGLIEHFRRYLRSPEFAPLNYRIIKNDAFHYLTIYLATREVHFWDYELYLLLFNGEIQLSYVDYADPAATNSTTTSLFKVRRLTFASVDALFIYLESCKSVIAQIAADMSAGEP